MTFRLSVLPSNLIPLLKRSTLQSVGHASMWRGCFSLYDRRVSFRLLFSRSSVLWLYLQRTWIHVHYSLFVWRVISGTLGLNRSALMMTISKTHGFLYNLLVTCEDHVLVLRRRCVSNEPPQAFTAAVARCPDLESLFKSMHLKTSPEKALQHLHLCFVPCFSSFHTDGVY